MLEQITGMLVNGFNLIFSPLFAFSPIVSLLIVSSFLTILVLGLNRVVTNRKLIKEIKDRMEQVRENLTAAQKIGDKENVNKLLAEMMSVNNTYMRQTFKAMIVSLVVIALFLPWLRYKYEGMTVATLPFTLPFIGNSLSWIYWYILVSFSIGWVVGKFLGD
jgi:uncharacterized membrane protein (DUF106 family)